jgi:hypothetical protein
MPPTLWPGGERHREGTLACGRGAGGVPVPTRGHTLWCSKYISTLWHTNYIHNEDLLPQIKFAARGQSLLQSMCTTLEKYDTTFLELNKFYPRANSLYAFLEATDLHREREYSAW